MTDLSTRVAALSGPDRAVDAEIAEAIGWLYAPICPELDCHGIDRSQLFRSIRSTALCPRFTASLDAAMTLLPSHGAFVLTAHSKTSLARVVAPGKKGVEVAATPALALCAAALKARGL